jgi:hypothetical protein
MNTFPNICPICSSSQLVITKFHCPNCATSIEGQFSPSANPFPNLTVEQLEFVKTFVRCEGKLNRLEVELGLSYPTLRNRLLDVIHAMGYEPSKDDDRPKNTGEVDRRRILDDLDKGKITAEQAMKALKN